MANNTMRFFIKLVQGNPPHLSQVGGIEPRFLF